MLVVWQGFPFIAVSVPAGLKTVPAGLKTVPGSCWRWRGWTGRPWQGFWKITYPMLKLIFLVLLLFSVIWDFNVFTHVQMIPGRALIIALFLDFNRVNLLQSLPGLVIVYSAQALPVSIWMLRNFVATVPRELDEAAAVDGAGPLRIFWRIMFPLVMPGLIATSVFSFITAYNEFVVALTFLGQAHSDYTLPIYVTYFFGRGGAEWGPIMAASTLYTIPVVAFFLLVQRRMTSGLVAGAVKG